MASTRQAIYATIDDDVAQAARAAAVQRRCSLRAVIEGALRTELGMPAGRPGRPPQADPRQMVLGVDLARGEDRTPSTSVVEEDDPDEDGTGYEPAEPDAPRPVPDPATCSVMDILAGVGLTEDGEVA
jgi:hypothetical protein